MKTTKNEYITHDWLECKFVFNFSYKLFLINQFPKMKHLLLLMLCVFTSFAFFSQTYESQSQEVQSRMDLNKINGVLVWDGIATTYRVEVQGLSAEGLITLQERSQSDIRVSSVTVDNSGILVFNCNGGTPFEVVKGLLSNLITGIVSFEERGSLISNSNE